MAAHLLYPLLTLLAVFTGFIDSVAGGGGLIMVPALLYAGIPPAMLLGTNKIQSACGTAIAAWRYHRLGLYRLAPNAGAVAAVFAGAAGGAFAISRLSGHVLGLVVPVLLMAVALYTLVSPRMTDEDSHQRLGDAGWLGLAGSIGAYDGFFGPGTGQFFATALVSLRGLGLTRATGLTKLFNLTSNLAAIAVFASGAHILWGLGLCMAAGAMAGNWLGAHTAHRHGARLIRPLLVTMSLGLTAKLVWSWFAG